METCKVYPTVDELSSVTNIVYCTETGCNSVFKSESNLNLHLAKSHKNEEMANLLSKQTNPVNRQYYCPDDSCIYNQSKYFKSLKLLKQHYLKVHSEKYILCEKCRKGFATESHKNLHRDYCGINFNCCDCEASYNCYDTLTTHARRKKHKILPKISYKKDIMLNRPASCSFLLLVKSDKSMQTEGMLRKCRNRSIREKRGIHSQTENEKNTNRLPQSAETQTIGDYVMVKSTGSNDSLKKHTDTQTQKNSTHKSCNTVEFNYECGDVEKSSFGTQTFIYEDIKKDSLEELNDVLSSDPTLNNIDIIKMDHLTSTSASCQTNIDFDLLYNSESQTDMNLNDFELFSSMYTQTCDDIPEMMEFSSNETQTPHPVDALKSVGSQTMIMVQNGANVACRDFANIETQTDFQAMLEEINA